MPLTLVFGRAGTGKSEYCIRQMTDLHKKSYPSLMIVPEQFAHAAETRLIEKAGFLTDEIQSVSFQRLSQKSLQKAGNLKKNISQIGKSMLLSKALLKASKDLTLYKDAATRPGFVDSVLTLISECKRSEITPKQLKEQAKTNDPYLDMKLHELSLLYESYCASLSADYTDTEDYLSLFAVGLEKTDEFLGTSVFIDEFFRFTPAELSVIRGFLLNQAEVFVTICAPDLNAGGIFAPATDTARSLLSLAASCGARVHQSIYLKELYRFKDAPELAHFESEYHAYPPKVYSDETKNLSLYIAPDIYTEVQVLAAKLRRLADSGIRYRDMAVLSGNPEVYRDLIRTVFPIYDIPVFIDQKRALTSHPMIVMLFSLLELVEKGLKTETILSYIKTGYSGLSFDEADRFENFALASSLKPKDWLDDSRFLKRADSVFSETEDYELADKADAALLLRLRDTVLSPILHLKENLSEDTTVRHRAEAIFQFLTDIHLYEKVQLEVEQFETAGDHQAAMEQGEIYNLLLSLLDELVTCLGDETIGISRLSSIISAGLAQCEMATIPPGSDQVFLGDVNRSLVKNVKALFVIGANDNTFPAPPPAENLIKDNERQLLSAKGFHLGPDSRKISLHNRYLVYSALNISCGSMTVSYAVSDLEGKGLRPSPLIPRLKKIFSALSVTDDIAAPPEPERLIAGKSSGWQYVLEHFTDSDEKAKALRHHFANDPDYRDRFLAARRYALYSNEIKDLSPVMVKYLYGENLRGSITRLERYRSCPFSYFLQYGLKAKERKILKIDAPDVGSLIHKLIELASGQIVRDNKRFGALDPDYIRSLSDQSVSELISTLFIKNLYSESRLLALVRRLKTQLAKMLQVISTHVARGAFEPCAFEVPFGEDGGLPPVTVKLPTGETITLSGRIDRIDALNQNGSFYIKIIDYKTGNKTFRLSDVYQQLSLQLAIYLTAVTEGGKARAGADLKPAGMFYFRLADRRVDAAEENTEEALLRQFKMSGLVLKDEEIVRAMDKEILGASAILPAYMTRDGNLSEKSSSAATLSQFDTLSAYMKRTIREIGREILSGHVGISPCKNGNNLPCEYCRYHSVCGFSLDKNTYRTAYPFKDDAVWALLEEEKGSDA